MSTDCSTGMWAWTSKALQKPWKGKAHSLPELPESWRSWQTVYCVSQSPGSGFLGVGGLAGEQEDQDPETWAHCSVARLLWEEPWELEPRCAS